MTGRFVRLALLVRRLPLINRIFWSAHRPINKNQVFWENSLDATLERELVLLMKWPRKKVLWSWRYTLPLGYIYLSRDNGALFSALDRMIAEGLIPPIDSGSHVFEPGCNVGAVLREAASRYGCRVTGMDISSQAIEYARNKTFAEDQEAEFFEGDVREWAFFRRFPDNHFSHVLSVSHLVHVPSGPEKDAYLAELKRIGQCVVLMERMKSDHDPMTNKIFMEDYEGKLEFVLFDTIKKKHNRHVKKTGIFYYRKH